MILTMDVYFSTIEDNFYSLHAIKVLNSNIW